MKNNLNCSLIKPGRLLIDTNLLLLLFIGLYDKRLITTFKRTSNRFIDEDFENLSKFVDNFRKIVTTPHILTELSNFSGELSGRKKDDFFLFLSENIVNLEEIIDPSINIIENEEFIKFGLTDTAIYCLSRNKIPVITVDFKLSGYLQSKNIEVFNFNHIRSYLFN